MNSWDAILILLWRFPFFFCDHFVPGFPRLSVRSRAFSIKKLAIFFVICFTNLFKEKAISYHWGLEAESHEICMSVSVVSRDAGAWDPRAPGLPRRRGLRG